MHTPISPGARRGRRRPRWLLLVLLLIAAAVAGVLLLLRSRPAPPAPEKPGAAVAVRQRSGYQNRGLWLAPPDRERPAVEAPRIAGTVYDLEGHTVEGAHIRAGTFMVAGNQSTTAGAADSGKDGRFELRLADGTYYLNASKEGYSPVMVMAHSGDDIGIVLTPGGVITGHVNNERGDPIPHFAIDVIAPTPDDIAAPAPFVSQSFDSPDGSFRVEGIPAHGVFVRATASQRAPTVSAMISVQPGETKTVDLTLAEGCVLQGTVVDEDGSPLSDVFIDAELRRNASVVGDGSIDATSQAESDALGHFTLEHVSLGDVAVRGYDGTHAVSTAIVKIESCDAAGPVTLKMTQGSMLTGVVTTPDGKPVQGAKISLSNRGVGFANTLTDAEGRYQFDRLPAGPMRVQALRGSKRAVGLVMVPESGTAERDLPFPAEGKGEIRGRITAAGQPLGGMQIQIVTYQGKGVMDNVFPVTAADGTYRAADLAPGLYGVLVMSTARVSSATVKDGEVATVDIDIAAKPKLPEIPIPKKGEAPAQEGAPAQED